MKYMGSKRAMLANGLGEMLLNEAGRMLGFLDLFSGSGAVSTFVAKNLERKVTAVDLQAYSSVLTGAVISRTSPLDGCAIWSEWESRAKSYLPAVLPSINIPLLVRDVLSMRAGCEDVVDFPLTRSYGGHYFSNVQSIWLDSLLKALPDDASWSMVCRAALISAASKCAAAPGHTAQPLQPSRRSIPFIYASWRLSVPEEARSALRKISASCAKIPGEAVVGDANDFAWQLKKQHLVFLDPPYSAVQYSRFYHVLESIARSSSFVPVGTGRYPPEAERPRSLYSMKGQAACVLTDLLIAIAESDSKCVLTFPVHECSNGLTGDLVAELARPFFCVEQRKVKSRFSTLGGTSANHLTVSGRAARKSADELILVMRPR